MFGDHSTREVSSQEERLSSCLTFLHHLHSLAVHEFVNVAVSDENMLLTFDSFDLNLLISLAQDIRHSPAKEDTDLVVCLGGVRDEINTILACDIISTQSNPFVEYV
jgi:hypothetical protein